MFIQYGNVFLHAVDSLQHYERENVYTADGADVDHVRHRVGAVVTYAPGGNPLLNMIRSMSQATSKRLQGDDDTAKIIGGARVPIVAGGAIPGGLTIPVGANPAGLAPGVAAKFGPPDIAHGDSDPDEWHAGPETDAELVTRLLNPRQKLILWVYDRRTGQPIRWLESPRPGFSVDAANGPKPIACDVIKVSGEPTSISVFFDVETYLPPCPIGSDRFVLSHRWEMSHNHDDDYYLTRVIEGEIRFHSGVRDLLFLQPDMVRSQFIHPIPVGFRRGVPRITASSDGLTIRYTITDTDPTIMFSAGDSGATRVEIAERFDYLVPSKDIF